MGKRQRHRPSESARGGVRVVVFVSCVQGVRRAAGVEGKGSFGSDLPRPPGSKRRAGSDPDASHRLRTTRVRTRLVLRARGGPGRRDGACPIHPSAVTAPPAPRVEPAAPRRIPGRSESVEHRRRRRTARGESRGVVQKPTVQGFTPGRSTPTGLRRGPRPRRRQPSQTPWQARSPPPPSPRSPDKWQTRRGTRPTRPEPEENPQEQQPLRQPKVQVEPEQAPQVQPAPP